MPVIPYLLVRAVLERICKVFVDLLPHPKALLGRQEAVDHDEPITNALVHAFPPPVGET